MVGIEVLCVDVDLSQEGYRVVLLYRSPSVPQKEFLANIETILKWLQENGSRKHILLGDFNVDLLKLPSSPLLSLMEGFGLKQVVSEPTHRTGSCLDHIYLPESSHAVVSVNATYYSDHHWVHAQVTN